MYILQREDQSLPNGSILHENLTEKKDPEMCILFNLASWKLYLKNKTFWNDHLTKILDCMPYSTNILVRKPYKKTSWDEYFTLKKKKKKKEEEEKNESLTLQKIPEMCT